LQTRYGPIRGAEEGRAKAEAVLTTWQIVFLGFVLPLGVLLAIAVARFIVYAFWSRLTAMGRFETRVYDRVEDSVREAERGETYKRLEQSLRGRKRVLGLSGRRSAIK
jgi:hypothetical protein